MSKGLYMILASDNKLLAKGQLRGEPEGNPIRLRLLSGDAEKIAGHDLIQLISMTGGEPSMQCRLKEIIREDVLLEQIQILDPEQRCALRTPVVFDSFLYPVSGNWEGRCAVRSVDLSCGGVSFCASAQLENGERAEMVIPVTTAPLLMKVEIQSQQELRKGRVYYAANFVNMCEDEEQMICESVFSLQLQNYETVQKGGRR